MWSKPRKPKIKIPEKSKPPSKMFFIESPDIVLKGKTGYATILKLTMKKFNKVNLPEGYYTLDDFSFHFNVSIPALRFIFKNHTPSYRLKPILSGIGGKRFMKCYALNTLRNILKRREEKFLEIKNSRLKRKQELKDKYRQRNYTYVTKSANTEFTTSVKSS